MNTAGIVLAGGASRRFGSPKAFARIGTKSFYELAVDVLKPYCDEVIIVTRSDLFDRYSIEEKVIADLPELMGLGPLAGILSAMEFVEADRYAVLPCDMPYMDAEVIRQLIQKHERGVVTVISGEKHHPLVSIWDRSTKEKISSALKNGQLGVMDLLSEMDTMWIPGNVLTENEELVFTNMNAPDILERG